MTNLDENVVPAFRRTLVNGKSRGGARRKGQTKPRSRGISSVRTSRHRTATSNKKLQSTVSPLRSNRAKANLRSHKLSLISETVHVCKHLKTDFFSYGSPVSMAEREPILQSSPGFKGTLFYTILWCGWSPRVKGCLGMSPLKHHLPPYPTTHP